MTRPRLSLTLALLLSVAVPVYPCGGPETYDIDAPLATVDRYLAAVEVTDDFDYRRRPELRFLTPFVDTRLPNADALWLSAYADARWNMLAGLDTTAAFSIDDAVAAFRLAARRGDLAGTERAARAVVREILGAPAVVADDFQVALRRAVEYLEIPPSMAVEHRVDLGPLYGADTVTRAASAGLSAMGRELLEVRRLPRDAMAIWATAHPGSPRVPSLRFVAVQLAMQRGIPDGYATAIRDSVPPARWKELAALQDGWLANYSLHPLAPWMRFARIRLAFFAGDTKGAWNSALDLYREYPVRALGEMRYLLQQGMLPASLDDQRIDDPLRTALLAEVPVDRTSWSRQWRRAEAAGTAGWSARARERLLWQTARDSAGRLTPLPDAFPATPSGLTPLAGTMRLLTLMRTRRFEEAARQAESLGADSAVAPMRAQLALRAGRWSDALAVPHLPLEARQYLVRVMAPDSVLETLARRTNTVLAAEARRTIAGRLAAAGQWSAGASRLPASDARIAALWQRTQRLATDTTLTGRLTYARWLRQNNGLLLRGTDKVWYRSVDWRHRALSDSGGFGMGFNPILPWTAGEEREVIGRHLRGRYEMYLAVRSYVDWLARAPAADPRRRSVVREADAAYNWLVNWDNNNATFWQVALEQEGIGAAIRRAGTGRRG